MIVSYRRQIQLAMVEGVMMVALIPPLQKSPLWAQGDHPKDCDTLCDQLGICGEEASPVMLHGQRGRGWTAVIIVEQ